MGDVVYESKVSIRRINGPVRTARIPGATEPVTFGVHGAIAEHYGVDQSKFEPHPTTIDHVVAAAGG